MTRGKKKKSITFFSGLMIAFFFVEELNRHSLEF